MKRSSSVVALFLAVASARCGGGDGGESDAGGAQDGGRDRDADDGGGAPDGASSDGASSDGASSETASPETASPDAGPPGDTQLHIKVVDSNTGTPVPAKIALWRDGKLLRLGQPKDPPFCVDQGASVFEIGQGGALATWNGIALYRGEATIPVGVSWDVPGLAPPGYGKCASDTKQTIEPGTYTISATRGPEYEIAEATVDLGPKRGVVDVTLPLSRVVDTSGYLAADMHIHTSDGSGDSSVSPSDRVKTEVAMGIEVMVSSEHDAHMDFAPLIDALYGSGVTPPPVASAVGYEASPSWAHFNVAPVPYDASKPLGGGVSKDTLLTWSPKAIFENFHALPTEPIVMVNHPRLGWAAYFDSGYCGTGGWTDRSKPPPCATGFDAIEVMSGFLGCDTKIRKQIEDWYALGRFGVMTTAIGNSDTHYTSGILAGSPRSYVRVVNESVAPFDEAGFFAGLKARAAVATTGPFLNLFVDGGHREGEQVKAVGGRVHVKVRMQAASWVRPDVVRILRDGVTVAEMPVGDAAVLEFERDVDVAADAFITAEAQGTRALPSWIVGEYLGTARDGSGNLNCPNADGTGAMLPFAVTNAVLVDADGDGGWRGSMQPIALPPPPAHVIDVPPAECDPRVHPPGRH